MNEAITNEMLIRAAEMARRQRYTPPMEYVSPERRKAIAKEAAE